MAEVAGLPPLELMENFWPGILGDWLKKVPRPYDREAESVAKRLPISWDCLKSDVLYEVINHSDCEGILPAAICASLADRLEGLLPLLPDEDVGGHIGNWRDKTKQFVTGLREAAAVNEDVEFY